MYSCTFSLIPALDSGWSTPRPGRLTPRKETRYPLYRRLDGPQGWSGRVRKTSPSTGIRSPYRPARNESLYRLSYPGPLREMVTKEIAMGKLCHRCAVIVLKFI